VSNPLPAPKNPGPSGPRTKRRIIKIVSAASGLIAVTAAVLAIPQVSNSLPELPFHKACTRSPAVSIGDLPAGGRVEGNFTLPIRVNCLPEEGGHFLLIFQPRDRNVDAQNPHAEYYMRQDMSSASLKTYNHIEDFSQYDIGYGGDFYIVDMSDGVYRDFLTSLDGGKMTLAMPDFTVSSNKVFAVHVK
jgi:hypothetical protein